MPNATNITQVFGLLVYWFIGLLVYWFIMKYHEMAKSYVFRELELGLSDKATLCFKNAKTVKQWEKGSL
ncbi:hypothetical protein C4D20_RS04895 [Vibrio parahaemolyticus]|nr:hypothetical protein [Vibrio parahaemolyticus]